MSNSVSTAQQGKRKVQTHPEGILKLGPKQKQFNAGTMDLLDEARSSVENAVGQGAQLNPLIYQMLGLQPQYEDHTADLQSAQGQMDSAQKQLNEANQTLSTIKGIPKGKRSPAQRKQLKQLTKQLPTLNDALGKSKEAFSNLQTSPKTITGLQRMDANAIPKESPFSALNPLNQAQATEAQRLNQYLQGGEVDPTLKHQYDSAEAALRAKLTARFGPDFESSTVGQMALQNFARQKNESFATYNQQQVEKYNQLAFAGQANLQSLLGGQIGLMREPSNSQIGQASKLQDLAGARLAQQQTQNAWALGHGGVTSNTSLPGALGGALASGGGQLLTNLTTPTTGPNGQTGPSVGAQGWSALSNLFSPAASGSVDVPAYVGGSAAGSAAADAALADESAGAVELAASL